MSLRARPVSRRTAVAATLAGTLAGPALLAGCTLDPPAADPAPRIPTEPEPDADVVLRALGPTVFGATEAQAFNLSGRGADQTSYRLISASGVQLLGFRKPGLSVRLDPPWQEAPAEGAWKVGLTWKGESNIAVQSDAGKTNVSGKVNYSYVVLDQRAVTIGGQTYRVWVINRQITDTVGGLFPASQEEWFMPYVGDVRTPEGLLLTGRNYASGEGK